MKRRSKTIIVPALAAAAALVLLPGCHRRGPAEQQVPEISGNIVEVNGYGQPIPDFTPAQMAEAGFDYADLINVTIGESYMLRQSLSIDRMIWLMCNEEVLENYLKIDWSTVDVSDIDWAGLGFYKTQLQGATLQASAAGYLRECGLDDSQIAALRRILTEGRK